MREVGTPQCARPVLCAEFDEATFGFGSMAYDRFDRCQAARGHLLSVANGSYQATR